MKALITGCGGQQGLYLAEFLIDKKYQVHGIIREKEFPMCNIHSDVTYHYSEMTEAEKLYAIIKDVAPDEIYNLAAMNSIAYSFENPIETMDVNFGGLVRIVESVRLLKLDCKIYHAGSSEIFGNPVESPQTENTKPNPRNPYGVSKMAGWSYAKICREQYGMKIYVGIIYNNDSPLRLAEFLSKKVCMYVASIVNGSKEKLKLGNLDARRDFGFSGDYVEWAWRILQHKEPDDFILATGITHSVKDFIKAAFNYVGIIDWEEYIEIDQSLYRPSENKLLVGDARKSKRLLDFEPKTTFHELIKIMMEAELNLYKK